MKFIYQLLSLLFLVFGLLLGIKGIIMQEVFFIAEALFFFAISGMLTKFWKNI